jgi:hypothetical protein
MSWGGVTEHIRLPQFLGRTATMPAAATNPPDRLLSPDRAPDAAAEVVRASRAVGRAHRILAAALIAVIGLAALGRLVWLGDMEFKSDEREWVDTLVGIWSRAYSPLAPESHHSGVPHSSAFFHFLRAISWASNDPLTMVGGIAGFSAAVMLLGLVLGRRSKLDLLALAMMGTSLTLFVDTRKIWTPDLIAAWVILGLVLWSAAERARAPRVAAWLTGASAFAFVMAPHMYLAAIPAAVAPTLAVPLLWLWRRRSHPGRARFRAWVKGALLGWATFIPYAVARCSLGSSSHSHPPLVAKELGEVLRDAFTLPSPLKVYLVYLSDAAQAMRAERPSLLLDLTLFWTMVAIVVWTALFGAVLVRLLLRWRQTLDSPMVVAALLAWMGTAAGILTSRLGSYINYWVGAVPFVYFLMAQTGYQARRSRWFRILRPALWGACVVALIATAHFALLIHANRGFPGEYGTSYYRPS